jgi:hypothetical protein
MTSPFETTRLSPDPCPVCKAKLDAVTILTSPKGTPEPGDFSICLYCGTVLRFGASLRVREAMAGEIQQLQDTEPKIFEALQKVIAAAKQRILEAKRSRYQWN